VMTLWYVGSVGELSDGGTAALLERLLAVLRANGRSTDSGVGQEEQSEHVENTVGQNQASNNLLMYLDNSCDL